MTFPPRPHAIGLDVVDPRGRRIVGKASDTRFVERIFTPAERERIRRADDPDLELWLHWAAKEAAFKAETCARGSAPVFDHSAFVFRPAAAIRATDPVPRGGTDAEPDAPTWFPVREGTVEHEGRTYPILLSVSGAVLALAGPAGTGPGELRTVRVRVESLHDARERLGLPDTLDRIRESPGCAPEAGTAHSLASATVRLALRADLRREVDPALVVFTPEGPAGRTPPWAGSTSAPHPGVDVSISHHGDLIAWAWTISAEADAS